MKLSPPRHQDHYPDRGIDCQEAADAAFREVWENLAAAGWGAKEIAAALYELTDNHLTALRMNGKTGEAIREARRARRLRGME